MPDLQLFLLYLWVAAAGLAVGLQQVVNARLRVEIGSPWWAGFISYAVGTLAMFAAIIVLREPWLTTTTASRVSVLAWCGGLFGAVFIATGILTVPRLGAATVLALFVVGQMVGALVFDNVGAFGLVPHPATWPRIAGAALLVAGVVLIRM